MKPVTLGEPRQSIHWVDVARGLGIGAVVLGHSGAPARLVGFVYLYHLALFLFVSGYLYSDKYDNNYRLFLWKRFRSLYIPFVIYQLIFLILHNMFWKMGIYGYSGGSQYKVIPYTLLDFVNVAKGILTLSATEQLGGSLWFVIVLFLSSILFGGISRLANAISQCRELLRFFLVLICVTGGLHNVYPETVPSFVNTALVCVGLLYAGYWYRRLEKRIPLSLVAGSGCIVLLWWLAGRGAFAYLGGNSYSSWQVLLVAPLAGIYANVVLSRRLGANRILELLGRQSFTIMALHFLAFKAVIAIQMLVIQGSPERLSSFPVWNGTGGWWLLYLLFGLGLPVAAGFLARWVWSVGDCLVRSLDPRLHENIR